MPKISRKEIERKYRKVVVIKTVEYPYILSVLKPAGINTGKHGFNFLFFEVGGYAICWGRANFPRGAVYDEEKIKPYEQEILSIFSRAPCTFKAGEKEKLITGIIENLLSEAGRKI